MNNIISRKIHIGNECAQFGKELVPYSEELGYQFAEAVMAVESYSEDYFSDCYLFALSVEIERLLIGKRPHLSAIGDEIRIEVLLTLLNYLEVAKDHGAIGVDLLGEFSQLLENEQTCCILDDIRDELVITLNQEVQDFQKISTLISDIAIYEPEAAERLSDIIDICIMEVFDDLKK